MVHQISLSQVHKKITVNWRFYLLICVVAFVILGSRQPDRILNAQFWAEDGTIFYANAYNLGCLNSLFLPYAGYLSIAQRLGASFLQIFPLAWAPFISNLIALSIQILPVMLVISARFAELIPKLPIRLLLAFIYLTLPNASEIHANLANSQWYLALLACLVILAKPSPILGWRIFDLSIILLSALSGPFSILLIPISVIYWRLRRNRWTVFLILGLAIGAVAQGITILVNSGTARHVAALEFSPFLLIKILTGQVFLGALIGEKGYGRFNSLPANYSGLTVLIAVLGLIVLLYSLLKGPLELRMFIIYGALIFLAALVAPTVPWSLLWQPGAATRYWFMPILAFVASLIWVACQQRFQWLQIIATLMLVTMSIGIGLDWQHSPLVDFGFKKYVSQFEHSPQGTKMSIPINPAGWSMELIKH
jgi:hypothetical protein